MSSGKVRLTRRGRVVLWIVVITAVIAFTYATRDICWTGSGYGSCLTFVDSVIEGK